jgi:YbgC/YbaW family acyl-CoA thioester hydrolase
MWGLGFFYSMHVVWTQGWTGFWVFAVANACGLALFGCALDSKQRDPETDFKRIGSRYIGLFLLCQIGAVAITLFSISAYVWPFLLPNAHAGTGLALSALVVTLACAVGHVSTLRRLRFLHVGYLAISIVAIAIAWTTLSTSVELSDDFAFPASQSVWSLLVPTFVGFALGPWGDLQQWQRAIEIRRSGLSPAIAYVSGGLIFFGLLAANAVLSRSAGANILIAADGAIGMQSSVAVRFGADGSGIGMVAFAIWVAIAAISTIDSFYTATRWHLSSLLTKSMHPAFAFVPVAAAASPLWVLGIAIAASSAMGTFGLSQTAYMMPYATLLVGATACLVAEVFGKPTSIDTASFYLWGLVAALIFIIGYQENIPILVPLSTGIAVAGAFRPIRSILSNLSRNAMAADVLVGAGEEAAAAPSCATAVEPVISTGSQVLAKAPPPFASLATANTNSPSAHGFDGQWFVMQVTPTYDDTNSVGNVYFANYVRWVGKARELFFNACMPTFDLETTRYLVLTKSFQHDFRRESAEFEPATIRIRIASHNRKFVTLGHEIVSERHGLLGRGEQDLMFVDRESFKPLDIPADIIRGFLPFWPSNRLGSAAPAAHEDPRKAG